MEKIVFDYHNSPACKGSTVAETDVLWEYRVDIKRNKNCKETLKLV